MIAIWGEGSAGSRYKSIIENLGFEVILLKRNKEKEPFNRTEYVKELTAIIANLAQAITIIVLALR